MVQPVSEGSSRYDETRCKSGSFDGGDQEGRGSKVERMCLDYSYENNQDY
jgi:hypothetical protein